MEKEYGSKKGESVFYASENKGTIKGVEEKKKRMATKMDHKYHKLRSGKTRHQQHEEAMSGKYK